MTRGESFVKPFARVIIFALCVLIITCLESCVPPQPTLQVTFTAATPSGGSPTVIDTTDTYYVNGNTGSDSNPGTRSLPFLTIQRAANATVPGNTVVVEPGNYKERVKVYTSGVSSAPIVYMADGAVTMQGFTIRADYITVKGFEITDTPNDDVDGIGIFLQGSFCDLEDNYIHYATRGGILLYAAPGNYSQTSNCVVKNNRLYRNSQSGIEVRGANNLILKNEIWGTIQYHPNWANPPVWVDADGIRFFGSGHDFRQNYIHDINYSDPQNVNPHIDCFQTWADSNHEAAKDIIFEQNRCDNISQAHSVDEGAVGFTIANSAGGILIRNNIISTYVGILIQQSNGVSILNNTLVSSTSLDIRYYPLGIQADNSTNILIENNILYDQPGNVIYIKNSEVASQRNLVYRSDGRPIYTTDTYNRANDLWNVNPLFVNADAGDYHLRADSPAIDAGVQVNDVPNDYEGNPRPRGNGFDIGAFEFKQ